MNFGFSEILFLLFLALLVVGPKRLPQIARTIGAVVAQFKRATAELEAQIAAELKQAEDRMGGGPAAPAQQLSMTTRVLPPSKP